ncbi:MAG: baseplate J/gp47 family protein [Chloroflexota bacterium]
MKTQILRLDAHDDRASVSDKLNWAQAPQLLLVWPAEARILTQPLDLVLLQRLARRKGAQLGLVTRDPDILDLAADLGIPVFDSPDAATGDGWRRRGRTAPRAITRRRPRPDLLSLRPTPPPSNRLALVLRGPAFVIAVASVLALVAAAGPAAIIRLPLKTRLQEMRLTLLLDPAATEPDHNGRVAGLPVQVRLREELRVPTTGASQVPLQPAQGMVVFTNQTAETVTIPAGTGVRATGSGDLRFLTVQDLVVAAGVGIAATVPVVAEEPGSPGNLPAGAIDAVEGPLGLLVRVTNPTPTEGGTEAARAAVALADRARLLRDVTALLLQHAEDELRASLEPGTALAPSSLRIVHEYLRAFDHEVGEPTDSLGLTLEAEVAGLAYRLADVEAAGRTALEAAQPEMVEAPGSFRVEPASEPTTDSAGQTSLVVLAQRRLADAPAYAGLLPRLAGRSPAEAASLLAASLELSQPPTIELLPSWWPRMPLLTIRIDVTLDWQE